MITAQHLKIGRKVNYKTQRGNTGAGKIRELPAAGVNGQFVHVEDAATKKVLKLRPGQLTAA